MTKKDMLKLVKEMYEIQKELNTLTFPNWHRELNSNRWDTAIFVEVAEAIDSLAWKWWKAGKDDLDNLKVELIDILHFVLSGIYYEPSEFKNTAFDDFVGVFLDDEYEFGIEKLDESTRNHLIEDLKILGKATITYKFFYLALSLKRVGIDFNNLYKEYITKVTLNIFRQKNGYKDGSYIKEWNGVEDNVVAYSLAEKIEVSENFRDELYALLKDHYEHSVKNGIDAEDYALKSDNY